MVEVFMLNTRLKQLRKSLFLSQEEFATETGISYRAYISYERGDRKPSLDFLETIVNKYHVNLNWLIANSGEMFSQNVSPFELLKKELLGDVKNMLREEGVLKI